jgi:hypothetical protein
MSINPYEVRSLRCVKCGAPLPEQSLGTEYIKCEFCGYTQKLVDVKDYLDKFRGEIYGWMKTIVPQGAVAAQTVDPIARHNIFSFDVKPKIMGDYAAVKSKLSTQLIQPMVVLPFYQSNLPKIEDQKECFENLAKIESLEQMAVIDEDRVFFDDIKVTYETYAYLANARSLISSKSDLSLLVNNFEQIASSFEKLPSRKIEYKRMRGVTDAYRAIDAFFKGYADTAKQLLMSAIGLLEEVLKEAKKSVIASVMVQSTTMDLSTLKAVQNLVEADLRLFESGKPMTEFLPYLERYFRTTEEARIKKGKDTGVYEELTGHLLSIIEAKNGAGYVDILDGKGDLLVPLWVISITYTFVTGALLWKKGKEVEDKLLVAATLPFVAVPVTDIFKVPLKFLEGVKGSETTLTSGSINSILLQVKKNSIRSSIKVIPPISTKEECDQIAEKYLSTVSERLKGKIRFGAAQPLKCIYATAEIRNNDVYISALGDSQIKLGSYLDKLMKITIGGDL